MSRFRTRASLLALVASAGLHAQSAHAAPGTIPNRTYTPDQLYQRISPELSNPSSQNQPHVVNGTLWLAGNAKHYLWNIADPFNPVQLAELISPHHDGEAESHQLSFARVGDAFYAATISGRGIDVWDVTDPAKASRLSSLELEGIDYGDNTEAVWGVFWQGQVIYVGGTNTGLHVVDASDPKRPTLVRRMPITELGGVSAGPLFGLGNLLIVTTPKDLAGIATLDISDPFAPSLLDAELPEQDSYIGGFYATHTYLLTPLRLYDTLSDPSEIRLVSSTETEDAEYMSFGDGHMFMGRLRPNPGATKIDVRNPLEPRVVADIPGRNVFRCDDQFNVPVGNLLVISDDERDLGSFLAVHQTERDSAAPRVAYANPVDGATGQALTSRVGLSFTDQIELASVEPSTLIVRPVGGAPLSGTWGVLHTLVNFWPSEPLAPDTTYEIVVPAGGIRDVAGNPTDVAFRSVFSTGSAVVAPRCQLTTPAPSEVGQPVGIDAANAGASASYRWDFGDGQSTSTAEPSASVSYAAPGRYAVRLSVELDGATTGCSATLVVHRPLTAAAPTRSGSVAIDGARNRAWVVNPDADTVAAIDLDGLERLFEVRVGKQPRTLAIAPDDSVWVTSQQSGEVHVLSAGDGRPLARIALPHGAMPYGIALGPTGERAFVTLEGKGGIAELDVASRSLLRIASLGPDSEGIVPSLRGIALTEDGARGFVTRFVSPSDHGEIYEIDPNALGDDRLRVVRTIELAHDRGPDSHDSGRGVPNYLSSIAISPDGTRAWLPGKKDNTGRGLTRDGQPLDPDNTVRTNVAEIDLSTSSELVDHRVDLDDHEGAVTATLGPYGALVFVASRGKNQVDVLDAYTGKRVAGLSTGLAPEGLALTPAGVLVVQSALSRRLDVYDVSGIIAGVDGSARRLGSVPSVEREPLLPDELLGKQIFHNGDGRQMSQDGYIACATCHLDGGQDGRVWDFTDRGEGLRNTISLLGKGGMRHGPVHWTGNFDEIQDFENDIRLHFGGSGLMHSEDFELTRDPLGTRKTGYSPSLDALAAYVSSLQSFPPSPFRNADGSLTPDGVAGRALFARLDCGNCHSGPALTDSALGVLHDVGTLKPSSGQRLGETLRGIDTPTLRGLWATAPYLHDGSAPTLYDVIDNPRHGNASDLSQTEQDQLVSFLLQLEDPGDIEGQPREPELFANGGCGCRFGDGSSPRGVAWVMLLLGFVAWRRRAWHCLPPPPRGRRRDSRCCSTSCVVTACT